jgi:hypothetical protein
MSLLILALLLIPVMMVRARMNNDQVRKNKHLRLPARAGSLRGVISGVSLLIGSADLFRATSLPALVWHVAAVSLIVGRLTDELWGDLKRLNFRMRSLPRGTR